MSTEPEMELEADARLMIEVKESDSEAALRSLYDKYRRPLCKFFYGFTYDYVLSEDCVQEVFLRLWKARKRYEPKGKFSTYLFQIGKNYWLNQKDKKDRRPNEYSIDGGRSNKDGETIRGQYESDAPEPTAQLARQEVDDRIQAAIAALPEKLRLVFVMSNLEGMKYRDISAALDIPEGTVKSRMSRAVHALRDHLAPYFEDETGRPAD